jgi:K+-transporting ATPase KdpF subunit
MGGRSIRFPVCHFPVCFECVDRERDQPDSGAITMLYIIAGVIALLLMVYLFIALLNAEKLG